MHPTRVKWNFDKCWDTARKRRSVSHAARDRKRADMRVANETSLAMAPLTKQCKSAEEAGATDDLIQTTEDS